MRAPRRAPGSSSIATRAGSTWTGGIGNKTLENFTAPANSILAANTTYWLVVKTVQGSYTGGWEATAANSTTTPVDWIIPGGEVNLAGGSSANTPMFSIQVTPEPGTLALAGVGALGLTLFRRRA